MSWAHAGSDDRGRPIGYAVKAKCDRKRCKRLIDRGLAYCCGTMHNGDNDDGCGGYFCGEHRDDHACEHGKERGDGTQ